LKDQVYAKWAKVAQILNSKHVLALRTGRGKSFFGAPATFWNVFILWVDSSEQNGISAWGHRRRIE